MTEYEKSYNCIQLMMEVRNKESKKPSYNLRKDFEGNYILIRDNGNIFEKRPSYFHDDSLMLFETEMIINYLKKNGYLDEN